jgi:transcriptional regulator with XRE-family HTH domain
LLHHVVHYSALVVDAAEIGRVALEVRRRRTERGWTLDAAAGRLGVSRRLLVQIEAGEANPSLSSLLSIAAGFGVPLVDLLAEAQTPPITIQADNGSAHVLWTGPAGGEGRLLVASGGLELWEWTVLPGEERRSDAHRPGAREALTVTAGTITIEVAGAEPATLRRGQSAAFGADVQHRYGNDGQRPARFLLAVYESS